MLSLLQSRALPARFIDRIGKKELQVFEEQVEEVRQMAETIATVENNVALNAFGALYRKSYNKVATNNKKP